MSISIYYTARRKSPLSVREIVAVTEIAKACSVDDQIESLLATGSGPNWESFHFAVNSEPGGLFKKAVVFDGCTKLPDNSEDAVWLGVQHWCDCLSKIRQQLSDCDWRVSVDDHAIKWDSALQVYDPST